MAWGSAGRGACLESILSEGSGRGEPVFSLDTSPTAGGVAGGGFPAGFAVDFDLRFLGAGVVAVLDGGVISEFDCSKCSPVSVVTMVFLVGSCGGCDSGAALEALRFFAGALDLLAFPFSVTPFCPFTPGAAGAVLLATRAERLRDMVCGLYTFQRMLLVVNRT